MIWLYLSCRAPNSNGGRCTPCIRCILAPAVLVLRYLSRGGPILLWLTGFSSLPFPSTFLLFLCLSLFLRLRRMSQRQPCRPCLPCPSELASLLHSEPWYLSPSTFRGTLRGFWLWLRFQGIRRLLVWLLLRLRYELPAAAPLLPALLIISHIALCSGT